MSKNHKRKFISLNDNQNFIYNLDQNLDFKGICFFLHGLGDSSTTFFNFFEHIKASGLDILYYDHLGHGENKDIELSFESNIKILKYLINKNALKTNPSYFIAHSMGGLILLIALSRYEHVPQTFKIFTIEPSITLGDKFFFNLYSDFSGEFESHFRNNRYGKNFTIR